MSAVCGTFSPFAYFPAILLAISAAFLSWLALRPSIAVFPSQLSVGKRTIAWQEIRSITQGMASPLVLRLRLTNNRRHVLIFPGEHDRIVKLATHIRNRSFLATFDGIPYQDYHLWSNLSDAEAEELGLEHPAPMISQEDGHEIERLYQKLKSVGHLDGKEDSGSTREE
ncbi:MAG TPA: hypothetical protein VH351_17310 [Bryobacteraceae bacterium]|nr:hypothetical protein [Bryobacteraceae bacterium]